MQRFLPFLFLFLHLTGAAGEKKQGLSHFKKKGQSHQNYAAPVF